MKPVVFSVFANSDTYPLNLANERDALENIFSRSDKISIEVLDGATSNRIYNKVTDPDLRQRIIIFHFAGHAGNKFIKLLDGEARALGLAESISKLPNLQLVFLNGCETFEQAANLLSGGVKAVITTLKPVDDNIAIDFTSSFYSAFYRFNSLNDSFEFAKAFVLTKYDSQNLSFLKLNRGLGEEDVDTSKSIYTLLSSDEKFLQKTLLLGIDYEIPPPPNIDYQPNRTLIATIADSIIAGNYFIGVNELESINAKYEIYKNDLKNGNNNNKNFHILSKVILEVLPYPISFHISILLSLAQKYDLSKSDKIELLNRQIITYNSLIQLLSFTLLSCLWKELDRRKNLIITLSQWEVLREFLSSNELNNQDINHPALIITVREILEKNNSDEFEPFIAEYQDLRDIFDNEKMFYEVHLHMQGLKSLIKNKDINRLDIHWLCCETEKILCKIFSKAGFIIRYKLTTVKDIEFNKSRLRNPSYSIKRIILDSDTVIAADVVSYDKFMDSHSVILAKGINEKTFEDFLSLSPFIIDENSLKGEDLSKLYFYSHSDGENYVYRWADDPQKTLTVKGSNTYEFLGDRPRREVAIINQRMAEVKKEIDAFKTLINN